MPEKADQAWIDREARFYLCGPGRMIEDMTSGLLARGVPAFRIFHEVFRSPANAQLMGSKRTHLVRFSKSNRDVYWTPKDGTLLSCGEAHGLKLPSGCRVGQCESCAVRGLAGRISYLTALEEADPGTCLTCQAIPATDLVLDA